MKILLTIALRVARNALLRKPPGYGLPTSPEDFGLSLSDPLCRERARGIFGAFFTGMEAALRHRRMPVADPAKLPTLYWPFYWEGSAMGQTFARLALRRRHLSLQDGTFSKGEPFALMRVVGVGFALGLKSRSPGTVRDVASGFDNFGLLVQDGYGFSSSLLRWRKSLETTLQDFAEFSGPERLSVFSGLGRSLWFRYMDRPEEILETVGRAEDASAILGGLGLAAAFTFPDQLERGYAVADSLGHPENAGFLKGVRIGLFVRHSYQTTYLEEELSRQGENVGRRARDDLRVALVAHEATHRDPGYIQRFHEECLRPAGEAGQ